IKAPDVELSGRAEILGLCGERGIARKGNLNSPFYVPASVRAIGMGCACNNKRIGVTVLNEVSPLVIVPEINAAPTANVRNHRDISSCREKVKTRFQRINFESNIPDNGRAVQKRKLNVLNIGVVCVKGKIPPEIEVTS